MKILLIAGHGAGDPGAVGSGSNEADLTREMAKKIEKVLQKHVDVTLFDTSKNMYRYLKGGGKFDFSPYKYVLEIHFNSGAGDEGGNGKTVGTEILVHENETGVSVEKSIVENIAKLGLKNRGVKRRGDLRNMNILHKQGIAYALLEVCFIDDADDMKIYREKKDLIATAVADRILKGFGIVQNKKELESVNDIVWELAERGIVSDKELWLKKLAEDSNAYWLARKCVNYIINNVR